jgi:hypothetical protein
MMGDIIPDSRATSPGIRTRTAEPGAEAPNRCRAHLPQCRKLLAAGASLAVEMRENWLEATRYLNMDHLKEHKKEALRALAA